MTRLIIFVRKYFGKVRTFIFIVQLHCSYVVYLKEHNACMANIAEFGPLKLFFFTRTRRAAVTQVGAGRRLGWG